MTEPVSYTTKAPNTVSVMFTGNSAEELAAVKAWVASVLPEEAEVYYSALGDQIFVVNGEFILGIGIAQYVYFDADGLHSVAKDAFEMVYAKDE